MKPCFGEAAYLESGAGGAGQLEHQRGPHAARRVTRAPMRWALPRSDVVGSHAEPAAVGRRYPRDDRQPLTPAVRSRTAVRDATVTVAASHTSRPRRTVGAGQQAVRQPRSVIGHRDPEPCRGARGGDPYPRAAMLDRVGDQIPGRLRKPRGITTYRSASGVTEELEAHAAGDRGRAPCLDRVADDPGHVDLGDGAHGITAVSLAGQVTERQLDPPHFGHDRAQLASTEAILAQAEIDREPDRDERAAQLVLGVSDRSSNPRQPAAGEPGTPGSQHSQQPAGKRRRHAPTGPSISRYPTPHTLTIIPGAPASASFRRRREAWESSVRVGTRV